MNKLRENYDLGFFLVCLKLGVGAIIYRGVIEILSYVVVPIVSLLALIAPENVVLYNSVSYLLSAIVSVLSFVFSAAAMWILLRVGKHRNYRPTYWRWRVTPFAPFLIIATVSLNFAMSEINSLLISLLSPNVDMNILLGGGGGSISTIEVILLVVSTAVIPGIVEEIMFRGIILTNLIPYGRGMAIVCSAFLFGLMHMNPSQFFYTTLMGIVLGYIYVRTRSIWICVLIHFTNNALGILQQIFYQCYDTARATELMGILMLSVAVAGIFSISVLMIVRHTKRKDTPTQTGSFGRIYEPDLSYEACPVTRWKKMLLFFSPSVSLFTAAVFISMITAAIGIFAVGLILGMFPELITTFFTV